MTAKSPKDILGLEYDWLACDAAGNVGFFSTAGAGFAPPVFLTDTDAHAGAIDALLAMPASTAAVFYPEMDETLTNTWRLIAERGVFAFDCNPNGGPYVLAAAPKEPVSVAALPALVRDIVCQIQFRSFILSQS